MKIVNKMPRLKVNLREKQYDLWWHGGKAATGNLHDMTMQMIEFYKEYEHDYICTDFKPSSKMVLMHKLDNRLTWLFEVKEAQ